MLPPLNADTTRILCVLAEGGRIEARRTFPHRHNFWLITAAGHKYAQQASDAGISTLLAHGLIHAITRDHPQCDEIDYHATSQGLEAVAAQAALPCNENSQLDLLGGAA